MSAKHGHTGKLLVDPGSAAISIKVLDHAYKLRASGYGRVEVTLPTGFYTVRYAAADARFEEDVTLHPNKTLKLTRPPKLEFSSPAPLEHTLTSHEYHQEAVYNLSRFKEPLKDSEFVFFARDLNAGGRGNLASGVSLCSLSGEVLFDLAERSQVGGDDNKALWAGCNLALAPGSYLLRAEVGANRFIETALHLVRGWQSQLFLLREAGGSSLGDLAAVDLPGATQLMRRPPNEFEPPTDPAANLRLAELARYALADERASLSKADLDRLLGAKWLDPLMGIYGVHLSLTGDKPDLKLCGKVVDRLRGLTNGSLHPDIEVLVLEISRRMGKPLDAAPFLAPPMLRRGWNMLIRLAARQPKLLPAGIHSQIARNIWGCGTWLTWRGPLVEKSIVIGPLTNSLNSRLPQIGQRNPIIDVRDAVVKSFDTAFEKGIDLSTIISQKYPRRHFNQLMKKFQVELQNNLGHGYALDLPMAELFESSARKLIIATTEHLIGRSLSGHEPIALPDNHSEPAEYKPAAEAKGSTEIGLSNIADALVALAEQVRARLSSLLSNQGLEKLCDAAGLGDAERALLLYVIAQLGFQPRKAMVPSTKVFSIEALVDRFGWPVSDIRFAAAGLVVKLAAAFASEKVEAPIGKL